MPTRMASDLGNVGLRAFSVHRCHKRVESGYFARSLDAYGRTGQPCRRCAAEGIDSRIVRVPFMNRASHLCPRCQPAPRRRRAA